jgi:hypothetical protein
MEQINKQVVESKSKDGKKLKVDGLWYSSFDPTAIGDVGVGDTVSFSYVDKESGGVVYHNIRGKVTKNASSVPAPSGSSGGRSHGRAEDDVIARRIARQNALTNAVALVNHNTSGGSKSPDYDSLVGLVVSIAKAFTRFTMGEVESAEATAPTAPNPAVDEDDLAQEHTAEAHAAMQRLAMLARHKA